MEPPRQPADRYDSVETDRGTQRPAFGMIDPFCLLPVGALLVMAVLFVFGGSVPIALGFVAVAALVALFDARVNRPAAPSPRSGSGYRVPAATRQPSRPVQPQYRAPQANPAARPAISRQPHVNRPMPGLAQSRPTTAVQHAPSSR